MNPHIEAHLVRDEGMVRHAYQDSLGFWTIGIGRLIDKRLGGGITEDEARYLLRNDIARVEAECRREFPWFGALDEVREAVVLNMVFNLGMVKFKGFVNTIADIAAGNYESAASRMLQSKWAQQVGNRALRLAEMMRTGEL
jgi:lysozyme